MKLEELLEKEKKCRHEGGDFGIKACKEAILSDCNWEKKSLYQKLEDYVKRAEKDILFNTAMILACWELINENTNI